MSREKFERRLREKAAPIEFRKTLGLLGATTLGVGSLMGAGLYVLVGVAAAQAGPSLWIAYLICGGLTLLSVAMFADLSRRLSISGGGYTYAYKQLGSFWGFMVGWHLAVGSVFACALYAVGFSSYFVEIVGLSDLGPFVHRLLSIGVVAALTLSGLRGGRGGNRIQFIFTWGNMLIILLLLVSALPAFDANNFTPALPNGVGGIGGAISLIYISFFGYQLIANSSEEIRDSEKTAPRAMFLSLSIAFVVYVLVAVISTAAVHWTELGSSEAPLVLVAQRGLGRLGTVIVGVGGVLASVAALNGTLVSQGRQIYAMGRDKMLPAVLGAVSQKNRIPIAAIVAGAGATTAALVLADLEFIAKSANFSLLFSMLPVSVALHKLFGAAQKDGENFSRWKRVVPWAALVANTGLLMTLDGQSLMFGGVVVGAGAVVFLSYSYSSAKRGEAGFSVALTDDERSFELVRRGERILVPMANPKTQTSLFSICQALLPPGGGEIVVLSVIASRGYKSHREALSETTAALEAVETISRADQFAQTRGLRFRPLVRAAKSFPDGIVHAAEEESARIIVMGWSARDDGSPSQILAEVASRVTSDLVFLQLSNDVDPKRVAVALGGKSNLPLLVRVGSTLAEQYQGHVTYFNVMPRRYGPEHFGHAREIQVNALTRHTRLVPYTIELLCSDSPLETIIERSDEFDLLVVGANTRAATGLDPVGNFASTIAARARCSVVIVRQSPRMNRFIPPQVMALRHLASKPPKAHKKVENSDP